MLKEDKILKKKNKRKTDLIMLAGVVLSVIIITVAIAGLVLFIYRKFRADKWNRNYRYIVPLLIYLVCTIIIRVLNVSGNLSEKHRKKTMVKETGLMFEKIKKICNEKISDVEKNYSFFWEGASEKEIKDWQTEAGAVMPDSYIEWLKLTRECEICSKTACFCFPEQKTPSFLPDDCVLIGKIEDDIVVFSRKRGIFAIFFKEDTTVEFYEEFTEVLCEVIKRIKN